MMQGEDTTEGRTAKAGEETLVEAALMNDDCRCLYVLKSSA
jgi:hypothetical protein